MRILIKIGSALISKNHKIDYSWLAVKIQQMAALQKEGHSIVLVTSGAVAAGMEINGLRERPKEVLRLQMLSGQGQVKLIRFYQAQFDIHNVAIGQVLLTHHNFDKEKELKCIVSIIDAYCRAGVIPVINENDMVSKDELSDKERVFTDNDILTALVGKNIGADLTVILTDVDGLYTADPKSGGGEIVGDVKTVTDDIFKMATKKTNALGLGGMYSKVQAAAVLNEAGIDTIVANGKYALIDILEGKSPRTFFHKVQP